MHEMQRNEVMFSGAQRSVIQAVSKYVVMMLSSYFVRPLRVARLSVRIIVGNKQKRNNERSVL